MTRVAVFIDYQNVYKGARAAFGWKNDPDFTRGQVFPRRLAVLCTTRGRALDADRQLEYVMVFRGEPSATRSPHGQAAAQRQVRFRSAQTAVQPVTRPLKYYQGRDRVGAPTWVVREKGIDVLIALAMVQGAMRDEFDVAVLLSCDTDLVPALEAVMDLGKRCEVAAWQAQVGRSSRLSIPAGTCGATGSTDTITTWSRTRRTTRDHSRAIRR